MEYLEHTANTPGRRLIIKENPASASEYVANLIAARINAFKPTAEKPFVLGLPTGSTPLKVGFAMGGMGMGMVGSGVMGSDRLAMMRKGVGFLGLD